MIEELVDIIAMVIALILILWLYIFLPIKMARKRGRSAFGWVVLFGIISPLWGIIVLHVLGDSKQKIRILGDSKQKIRKDIIEELHRN